MKSLFQRICLHRAFALLLLSTIGFAGLNSCSVHFVPSYEKDISDEVTHLMKKIDVFYLRMNEMDVEERGYDQFVDEYIQIEAELKSLYFKNKVRPLNEESTENCLIALQQWQKYKARHKARDSLSSANIELQNTYMHDVLYYILVAEEAKKDELNQSSTKE
jgi:hypothetical protein